MKRILLIILILAALPVAAQVKKENPYFRFSEGRFKKALPVSDQIKAPAAVIISRKDSGPMILIPGGAFIYGNNDSQRDSILDELSTAHLRIFDYEFDERRIENLPSYYIDKYEVTNGQYARFMEETGHRQPAYWNSRLYGSPKQPVVGVGWADAEAYAKWAGKRLPSEEEWEKAARGEDGRIWPWGNEPSGAKYNGSRQGYFAPVEVGSFEEGASPYGVMDMAGNVYEMTTGEWAGSGRAMRGGCFLNAGAYTRTTFRWAPDDEINGANWLGFRCVMDTTTVKTMARPANRPVNVNDPR